MDADPPAPSGPPGLSDRYERVAIEDHIVIFDLENHHAWIQSTLHVDIEDYR